MPMFTLITAVWGLLTAIPPETWKDIGVATGKIVATGATSAIVNKALSGNQQQPPPVPQGPAVIVQNGPVNNQNFAPATAVTSAPASAWFLSKKLPFATATVGILYFLLQLHLKTLAQSLQKTYCWSLWQPEKDHEQLNIQEFLQEIQTVYSRASHIHDVHEPIALFLQDLAREEECLQEYCTLFRLHKKCNLLTVSSADKKLYDEFSERLYRCAALKKELITWIGRYKMRRMVKACD